MKLKYWKLSNCSLLAVVRQFGEMWNARNGRMFFAQRDEINFAKEIYILTEPNHSKNWKCGPNWPFPLKYNKNGCPKCCLLNYFNTIIRQFLILTHEKIIFPSKSISTNCLLKEIERKKNEKFTMERVPRDHVHQAYRCRYDKEHWLWLWLGPLPLLVGQSVNM